MDDWVIMEYVSSTPTLRDNIQKFVYEIIKRKDCYREIVDDYDVIKIHKLLLLNEMIDKDLPNNTNSVIVNYYYGLYYEFEKIMMKCLKYYLEAIKQNDVKTIINLQLYYRNIGDTVNEYTYHFILSELNSGNESAWEKFTKITVNDGLLFLDNTIKIAIYNSLGKYYREQKKYSLMLKYYKLAISIGSTEAMSNIGSYCQKINDVPNMIKYYCMAIDRDDEKAIEYLCMYYIKQNNSDAICEWAQKYKIKQNMRVMVKMYQFAIDSDNVNAMLELGKYYEEVMDYDNMLKYYQMALEYHGSDVALSNLESYYIKNNDTTNMYSLATYYKNKKDYQLMIKCLQLPVKQKNSNAMYDLGEYYQSIKEIDKMLKYYKMAILLSNVNAMYNLGLYYENEKDYVYMLKYYYMAIKHYSEQAMQNLGNYYDSINDNMSILKMGKYFEKQKLYGPALNCYYVATQLNNFYGWHKMGKLHQLTKTTDKMIECYVKSSIDYKCSKSMYNLATYYKQIGKHESMLKYYSMYIDNIEQVNVHSDCKHGTIGKGLEIYKLSELMVIFSAQNSIPEFVQLYDKCLTIYREEGIDDCPICFDGCGKYRTKCCKQYGHYSCLMGCKSCPWCRSKTFI